MFVITDNCRFCNTCITICPVQAIEKTYPVYRINTQLCLECGECQKHCRFGAIEYVELRFTGTKIKETP